MTNDDKTIWRERWLECINELTSYDLQKIAWLDNSNSNPHWSYIEFMSNYFDDLVIENNYEHPLNKGWLTNQEFEIINEWHQALKNYESPNNDDYNNFKILNDPNWINIIKIGLESKSKLANTLSNKENEILTKDISYLKFVK